MEQIYKKKKALGIVTIKQGIGKGFGKFELSQINVAMYYSRQFDSKTVNYFFDEPLEDLYKMAPREDTVILTDSNVRPLLSDTFNDYRIITVDAGEDSKSLKTLADITKQMMKWKAHRGTLLLGVGGGVVTDLSGFAASMYMRGIRFGYLPSSLLGMVDAAVGGKTGINFEEHKNMLGTFNQPDFIWYHLPILKSLPNQEWSNGFAEIIKYGLIADIRILTTLLNKSIGWFQRHPLELGEIIEGCVDVKNKIVCADEEESGLRMMLNFGHTAGHAFESLYHLSHGDSVALGMQVACLLSEQHTGLDKETRQNLKALLQKYHLPIQLKIDVEAVVEKIQLDKKRSNEHVNFVLLEKPGVTKVKALNFEEVSNGLKMFVDECSN